MSLISIVIVLIVVGLALYLITLLPIDANIKKIIQAIVIVLLVIWLLARVVAPLIGNVKV